MYESQFLLKRRPFAATPDPKCFLASGSIQAALDELVVTDSIPLSKEAQATGKIRVLSCAGLLAETILRIVKSDSVSSLFVE